MPHRELCRVGLPLRVALRQAAGAGPVAGGDRGRLVAEEDAVADVVTAGDPALGAAAVEPPLNLRAPVTAQRPGLLALVGGAVGAQQPPGGGHRTGGRCGILIGPMPRKRRETAKREMCLAGPGAWGAGPREARSPKRTHT